MTEGVECGWGTRMQQRVDVWKAVMMKGSGDDGFVCKDV